MDKIGIIKRELVSIEDFFESKKDEISSSMYSKELNKIFKDLSRIRKEIDSETYFISIIGGIKTGKSTLINLLCHKNVSTTRAGVETTKRPVIVSIGEEDKIIIFKKDDISGKDVDDDERNSVIDYVKGLDSNLPNSIKIIKKDFKEEDISNILTNSNLPNSDKIILIHITVNKNHLDNYKNCLLKNKIMFIDTPGLDGIESSVGGINNNNGHWLLNRVDLSIILQSTVSPINNSLVEYLEKLLNNEEQKEQKKSYKDYNYMLVHNRFSLKNWLKDIDKIEEVINNDSITNALKILEKIDNRKFEFNEVDLAKAEDAYEKSDNELKVSKPELLEESKFEVFEKEIYDLIQKNKKQSHIDKCLNDLKSFIYTNEFKSNILNNLQEKENYYKNQYNALKALFNWEKVIKEIKVYLENTKNEGFNFNKQINILEDVSYKKKLIQDFRSEIKKNFLVPENNTNLIQYIFQRNIFDNKTVEFLIDLFEIEFKQVKKGNKFKFEKDEILVRPLKQYLNNKLDDFINNKNKEIEKEIDLAFYEGKKFNLSPEVVKDDISDVKSKLQTKSRGFIDEMKKDLLFLLKEIFDEFHFYLVTNEQNYLEKFIGEKSKLEYTKKLLTEIETYLNKLKQQVELN